jgi:elongation factor P--(R)-beta-lysine ligase
MMKETLLARHALLKAVRDFFYAGGYVEVETPNLMRTAPPDPFIEPLEVFAGEKGPFFLHTSPEIGMKKLLPICPAIFQICKTYRVEELDEAHNTEFTMLEWYMPGTYDDAIKELSHLVSYIVDHVGISGVEWLKGAWASFTLESIFVERTGVNPLDMDKASLLSAMKAKGLRVSGAEGWDELFFMLYVQEVEPWLHDFDAVIVRDWPQWLSSMARKKDESRVERFEFYVRGLELANGYTELLDAAEQRNRFLRDNKKRMLQDKQVFPLDLELLEALSKVNGPIAGVSVGLDRLLMVLLRKEKIEEAMPYRIKI